MFTCAHSDSLCARKLLAGGEREGESLAAAPRLPPTLSMSLSMGMGLGLGGGMGLLGPAAAGRGADAMLGGGGGGEAEEAVDVALEPGLLPFQRCEGVGVDCCVTVCVCVRTPDGPSAPE